MIKILFLLAVISIAASLQAADFPDLNIGRDKRYTDTQDRASAFCTGLCMYERRKAYSQCYDLCNWNGRGPSPWTKLDGENEAGDQSTANMQALMRSGAGGGKLRGGRRYRGVGNKKGYWQTGRK